MVCPPIWQLVTGSWVTVTERRRDDEVLIWLYDASPAGCPPPGRNAPYAAKECVPGAWRYCVVSRLVSARRIEPGLPGSSAGDIPRPGRLARNSPARQANTAVPAPRAPSIPWLSWITLIVWVRLVSRWRTPGFRSGR